MKIEQHFGNEKILTRLAVMVDSKIQVHYKRCVDKFGFIFSVYGAESKEVAMQCLDEIVSIMEHQSYDHGAEWRKTNITDITDCNESYAPFEFEVEFRIKDSY